MYYRRTDKRGLVLWEIRLAIIAAIVSFITALLFDGIVFDIISLIWMCAYVVMAAWYYPIKYRKLSYNIDDNILVVNCGVIYRRRKSIFLNNIQYITSFKTPLQSLCGLRTVVVHAAGGFISIPNLKDSDADILIYTASGTK